MKSAKYEEIPEKAQKEYFQMKIWIISWNSIRKYTIY